MTFPIKASICSSLYAELSRFIQDIFQFLCASNQGRICHSEIAKNSAKEPQNFVDRCIGPVDVKRKSVETVDLNCIGSATKI